MIDIRVVRVIPCPNVNISRIIVVVIGAVYCGVHTQCAVDSQECRDFQCNWRRLPDSVTRWCKHNLSLVYTWKLQYSQGTYWMYSCKWRLVDKIVAVWCEHTLSLDGAMNARIIIAVSLKPFDWIYGALVGTRQTLTYTLHFKSGQERMDHFSSVTEVFKHAANERVIETHC